MHAECLVLDMQPSSQPDRQRWFLPFAIPNKEGIPPQGLTAPRTSGPSLDRRELEALSSTRFAGEAAQPVLADPAAARDAAERYAAVSVSVIEDLETAWRTAERYAAFKVRFTPPSR